MVGLAAPFGVVALLNAQAKLDHQAELYVQAAGARLQSPMASASVETGWQDELASAQSPEPPHAGRLSGLNQPSAPEIMPAEGKKAIAVRVSNGLAALDFAQPDRWVDVVLTRQIEISSVVNDVIVQNARILAVDVDGDGSDRSMARSVTLEVDMVDAQKLLLASQVGTLSLLLRRPGDLPASDARQVDITDLTTATAPPPPQPSPAMPASAPSESVSLVSPPAPPSAAPPMPEPPPPSETVSSESPPPPAAEAAREHDERMFSQIRVRRPGADSSVHRVPREEPPARSQ